FCPKVELLDRIFVVVVARSDSFLLDVVPLLPGGILVAWIVVAVVVVVAADDVVVAAAADDVVVAQGIPSSPR
ncbi:hypothetical protein A2U01_0106331, partial [Trifolium medium]|nr:hypothetical protein [Trifolium medium]